MSILHTGRGFSHSALHVVNVNFVHFQLELSSLNIHLSIGLEEDDLKSPTQPTAFLCGGVVTSCWRSAEWNLIFPTLAGFYMSVSMLAHSSWLPSIYGRETSH